MRDGHIRVLPLHVANKIAAGEVVERPASVVKELVENAIDAGAKAIKISISQGGRKLVAVQDDGCGMTRDDAVLSLERQATSKIADVDDIERIDTLGFRGEAIPSIASVSRFSITTRRHESDEGTFLQVNAGTLAEVRAAGCPPGTLVEVRDLFCNVPARRKFLRAYATEESHVKQIFTVHALAHPAIAFTLVVDGRELYRLAAASDLSDRVRDLFGDEFLEALLPLAATPTEETRQPTGTRHSCRVGEDTPSASPSPRVTVSGFVERPNLFTPTRREQYIFVNGRPATAPSVAYALREAYPRRPGDVKPATILFISLPPTDVDVNVHPTKREVRFRDNVAVKQAIVAAIDAALAAPVAPSGAAAGENDDSLQPTTDLRGQPPDASRLSHVESPAPARGGDALVAPIEKPLVAPRATPLVAPVPVQQEIAIETSSDGESSKPWRTFRYLAQTDTGYLLIETDSGLVTINPIAARERLAYEKLLAPYRDAASPHRGASSPEQPSEATQPQAAGNTPLSQALLIPETVRLSPVDFARLNAALDVVRAMGFQIEEFGANVFKIDAVPQLLGTLSPADVLATIAHDLSEVGAKRGDRWREELIAKSIARSFAGAPMKLTEEGATKLVEELCRARMPYVCPRGKPVMIFTSTRELNRKFDRD